MLEQENQTESRGLELHCQAVSPMVFFNNYGGPDDQRASTTICHG
jgi:hypothetical protein